MVFGLVRSRNGTLTMKTWTIEVAAVSRGTVNHPKRIVEDDLWKLYEDVK